MLTYSIIVQHIPRTIRFRDQIWKSGDMVKFRTGQGFWDIKIVLNGTVARFSRGWSKFVKDLDLKEDDNLRFTLQQDSVVPTFNIEVNPPN